MNRHAVQLISRGAINKIGNMLYDYGNSVWLASMGTIGKTVLGIYQISELVTGILVNPFGGVPILFRPLPLVFLALPIKPLLPR